MAELDLGAGPIFVDVSSGQQYPLNDFNQTLLVQPQEKSLIVEIEPIPDERPGEKIQADPGPVTEIPDENSITDSTADVQVFSHSSEATTAQTTSDSTAVGIDIQDRIRCPECQRYTAETEEKMLRHIRKVHRGENPFQCLMCDYSTYNKILFEEHVRIHQGIKPYKCSQCPYRSVSKKNTKKHELIHRPDNPLKCGFCEFIARHPRALECHAKSHIGEEVKVEEDLLNACPNCPFKYSRPEELRNHKKSTKRCPDCDYRACSGRILTAHMLNVHKKRNSASKKKVNRELFKCRHCTWGSSNKIKILLHLIHHPHQKVDETVIDIHILRKFGIMK